MTKSKQTRVNEALAKIEEGLSLLQDIAEEITKSWENMSDTSLEYTGRFLRYEVASDELSQICDNIETSLVDAKFIKV